MNNLKKYLDNVSAYNFATRTTQLHKIYDFADSRYGSLFSTVTWSFFYAVFFLHFLYFLFHFLLPSSVFFSFSFSSRILSLIIVDVLKFLFVCTRFSKQVVIIWSTSTYFIYSNLVNETLQLQLFTRKVFSKWGIQ